MRTSEVFPSRFLKPGVSKVEIEDVGDDRKAVAYFVGKEKGLVLNRTNWDRIALAAGTDDTDEWPGVKVQLYTEPVTFNGKTAPAVLDANAPDGFLVHSFADDDPITCKDYVREKAGLPVFKPKSKLKVKPSFSIKATYNYTDEKGELLYQVVRLEPKSFRQRRPDGKGGWTWSVKDCRRIPYRLPELLKYPDACVFVCEGEKDADRIASLDHCCATTVACGDWSEDCVEALAGRDVLILEDNDDAARKRSTPRRRCTAPQRPSASCGYRACSRKVTSAIGSMSMRATPASWRTYASTRRCGRQTRPLPNRNTTTTLG